MRIANRRRDAVRKHAAVELSRSDQRALAMHMAIDEAGHGEAPFGVDLLHAAVAVEGAHDHAAANSNVPRLQFPGDNVQDAGVAHDQIGRHAAQGLIDLPFQHLSHAQPPVYYVRFRIIG